MTGSTLDSLSSNHIWNVVKVDGKYYFVDCTWDGAEVETTYDYYLKGRDHFPGHTLDKKYEYLPIQSDLLSVVKGIF